PRRALKPAGTRLAFIALKTSALYPASMLPAPGDAEAELLRLARHVERRPQQGSAVKLVVDTQTQFRHRLELRLVRHLQGARQVEEDRPQGVADADLVAERVQAQRVVVGAHRVRGEHVIRQVTAETERNAELRRVTVAGQEVAERG